MRQKNLASFLIFSPLFLLFLFFGRSALGQTTDLRIDFSGPQPDFVQVGAFFAIQATVSFDVNGTNPVPAGETVIANIEFRDPSGLIVASHIQQWNGFPENGNPNTLSNSTPNNGQVLFQVPWSEDDKWNAGPDGVPGTADDEKWTIAARVSGASRESDLSDNQISHQFSLSLPNLTMSNNLGISSRDPISGATSSEFFPNSNVSVTGSVQNDSLVRTQEGVWFRSLLN